MPAWSCVTDITSRNVRPSISTSLGSAVRTGRSPSSARPIAFTPSHGRAEWADRPVEDDARVEVAETAELQGVVRRFEADDELSLVHEAGAVEDGGEGIRGRSELLAREEEEPEVVCQLGLGGPARELDHHREPAFHVTGTKADDRTILDSSRQVPLGRHGVRVAGEQDERLAASLGENHCLAVREGMFQWDDGSDVAVHLHLPARFGRDVHEIQGALGECHNRDR